MCGVFGIRSEERDVSRLAYFGLFALQHRGQESAGIAVSDAGRLTVLRDMGLPTQGLALSLLGFNVGVELGQALVVALVLPALALLWNTRWETRVVQSASLAILLVGVVLFVERTLP